MTDPVRSVAAVRALAADNARLHAEVLRLRERAYGVEGREAAAFAEWFGLGATAARVLAALYAAAGEAVEPTALAEAGGCGRRRTAAALTAIEAALDPGALEPRPRGPRLSSLGRRECDSALAALVGRR
jgi:hypothetical protein